MAYYSDGNKVVRDDGYVALQHRNSNPTAHKIDGVVYQFSPKKNVSMSWVAPEHVDRMLSEDARICCGKTSKKFFLASIINVNLWTYGTREAQ